MEMCRDKIEAEMFWCECCEYNISALFGKAQTAGIKTKRARQICRALGAVIRKDAIGSTHERKFTRLR